MSAPYTIVAQNLRHGDNHRYPHIADVDLVLIPPGMTLHDLKVYEGYGRYYFRFPTFHIVRGGELKRKQNGDFLRRTLVDFPDDKDRRAFDEKLVAAIETAFPGELKRASVAASSRKLDVPIPTLQHESVSPCQ